MITKKQVDKIVWWIPFKSVRDFFREYFYTIIDLKRNLNIEEDYRMLDNKLTFILEREFPELASRNGTVIIKVAGRLADQIVYYAFGVYIETIFNKKVKYDIATYGTNIKGVRNVINGRNFELLNMNPNLEIDIATNKEIDIYKSIYFCDISKRDKDDLIAKRKNLYTYGFPSREFIYNNLVLVSMSVVFTTTLLHRCVCSALTPHLSAPGDSLVVFMDLIPRLNY